MSQETKNFQQNYMIFTNVKTNLLKTVSQIYCRDEKIFLVVQNKVNNRNLS